MSPLPLVLFAFTYLGLAIGRVPGLALDRTGFAILGAVAFLATGELTLSEAKEAVDAETIVVLWGMMVLSAQYQLSGLYTAIGDRLARVEKPRRLLAGTIVVSALLASVLTNDVICFALTPLVGMSILRAKLPPFPFLAAIACATNIGSALTPIGNPQNILIASKMDLAFLPFVLACAVPVALSLLFVYFLLAPATGRANPTPLRDPEKVPSPVPLDRREALKALALTAAAIALFLTPIPKHHVALGVAGVVLLSRKMHTRTTLALVDWHMLALFTGLFIVVGGLEKSGWVAWSNGLLLSAGTDLTNLFVLAAVLIVLGNLVGNVPTVMLLLPFVGTNEKLGWFIALVSTFSGNALLIGSVANIIVAEQSERLGIPFGFRQHLRIGLPATLFALVVAAIAALVW